MVPRLPRKTKQPCVRICYNFTFWQGCFKTQHVFFCTTAAASRNPPSTPQFCIILKIRFYRQLSSDTKSFKKIMPPFSFVSFSVCFMSGSFPSRHVRTCLHVNFVLVSCARIVNIVVSACTQNTSGHCTEPITFAFSQTSLATIRSKKVRGKKNKNRCN